MRFFVTGVGGQLGGDVLDELVRRGHEAVGSDRAARCAVPPGAGYLQADLVSPEAVRAAIASVRPDAVIHCAAWTAVDDAEDPANRERVFEINEGGTRSLAGACSEFGARMLYISTDYVFGGGGETPWVADCRDFAPLNVYGQSKLAGERAVEAALQRYFIVRTAWVFGPRGRNFVETMLRLAGTHEALRVVCDQVGTPTYTGDLARLLCDMAEGERYGVYHATNEGGYISWYDFAVEIFRQVGLSTRVVPVTTAEYGASRAARPLNSRLDREKLRREGFAPLPDWRDALARYLAWRKSI